MQGAMHEIRAQARALDNKFLREWHKNQLIRKNMEYAREEGEKNQMCHK